MKRMKSSYVFLLLLPLILCSKKELYPKIENVEPKFAWTGENTQIVILGTNFIPTTKVSTTTEKIQHIPPKIFIGNYEIPQDKILFFSRSKIEFILTKGFAPGDYKLSIALANGKKDSTDFKITKNPKPIPENLSSSVISNNSDTTVVIQGQRFEEITEIILIRQEDGKQIVLKDFTYSSTEIQLKIPQGFETGNFTIVVKNSEGLTSDPSEKIVLSILMGPQINIQSSYELDPENGKVKIFIEIENSGEVELQDIQIELSTGDILKIQKIGKGKQKITAEIYVNESTQISWTLQGKDSINSIPITRQGSINICKNLYYKDGDGDGYGNKNEIIYSCNAPQGYVSNSEDCNDLDPNVNPKTVWYKDNDTDGYTDGLTFVGCVSPERYILTALLGDCNDDDSRINPSSSEVCNGIDDNCNGIIDEGVMIAFYRDKDSDGYGALSEMISSCAQPSGYVSVGGDCDDNNATIKPGASEICNGIDDDCDGFTDEQVLITFYQDSDGDGYGNPSIKISACSKPNGYVENSADCDDSNSNINPLTVWYKDADNDFYSDGTTQVQCQRPQNYKLGSELISTSADCNDQNSLVNPNTIWYKDVDSDGYYPQGGSQTSCLDPYLENSTYIAILPGDCDDSNALINPSTEWYVDSDLDGYYGSKITQCSAPANATYTVQVINDCNDSKNDVYPGAPLLCVDNEDNDCDSNVEKWAYTDADGDRYAPSSASSCTNTVNFPGQITLGYELGTNDCNDSNSSVHPGAPLNCNNGQDNDCSGQIENWFYQDQDSDTWTTSVSQCANTMPSGFTSVSNPTDCDDTNSSIYPGAPLNCNNGQDNDCSGQVEAWFYQDQDSDTWTTSVSQCANSMPSGFTSVYKPTDCDDNSSSIYPGAPLNCNNGQDNDCSGQIENWFYQDQDSDTWTTSVSQCANSMPSGFTSVSNPTDCNDTNSSIYPGAPLNCNNGQDNDCSGQIENWFFQDQDNDTWTTSVSQCSNTMPTGFTSVSKPTDCNDTNSSIYPGAPLNCNNGQDNDCSGQIENWFYQDQDSDTWTTSVSQCANTMPSGFTSVSNPTDCNDTNSSIYPGAPLNCNNGQDNDCSGQVESWFYQDQDSDTWTTSVSQCANTMPTGFTSVSKPTDCDDNSSSIYPGASLNCNNGQDNDCSGQVEAWFYQDQDSDTWTTSVSQCANSMPSGFTSVSNPTDCNDTNSSIYPGAPLNCNNGQDNDCSGQIENWFFQDQDSDTWTTSVSQCSNTMPSGFTSVSNPTDCNDTNSSIYPGAPLNCNNGQDNDCSGQIENWFYQDQDSDTWTTSVSQCANSMPSGFTSVSNPTDCNDTNSSIYPGAPLNCNNGQDNDCSGQVESWFYQDQDLDTWTTSVSQCANSMPSGFTSVSNPEDCNDSNSSIYPGAALNCNNNQDNDCSGQIENWFYQDSDSDTWTTSVSQCANTMPAGFTSVSNPTDCNDSNSSIHPGASEICNGIDDNCNTNVDEGLSSCYIPSCPTSITATSFFGSSTGDISIQITWNDPATNESNFVLEKSKSSLFSPSVTYVIPADNTSKTLTFQEPLTQFWFRVWATNSSGACTPLAITSTFTPPGLLWSFSLTGTALTWNSRPINPKSFDLNGDNINEIIIADDSGYVYAVSTVKQNLEVFAKALWVYYAGSGWESGNIAVAIYQSNPTIVIPMRNNVGQRRIVYINSSGQAVKQTNVNIDSYPPIITDIDGDSKPDILFSSNNFDRIRAYKDGIEIFNINPAGVNFMPALFYFKGSLTHYVFGTDTQKILGYVGTKQIFEFQLPDIPLDFITTGNIDSDEFSEAVVLRGDGVIDVLKLIKNPLLIYNTADQIRSKPAFADFNSDGITDVVFTAGNNLYFVYGGSETSSTCSLTSTSFSSPAVIQGNSPTVVVGRNFLALEEEIIRIRPDCSLSWQQDAGLNKDVRSSPLIFDIDEDGEMEVIVGTADTALNSGQVMIINLADGSVEATVSPAEMGRIYSSARADDIDNDGIPEIVIGSDKASLLGSGGAYIISCGGNGINCSNSTFQVKLTATKSDWGMVRTIPLIYDLNSDGYKDIVLAEDNNENLFAISGTSVAYGQTYTLWETTLSGVGIGLPFPSSPTIIIKNGTPYIAIGSDNSTLYILNGIDGTLVSSFGVGDKIYSSPTTLDYNLDGVPDLIFGSDDGKVYTLSGTDFTTILFSYQTGNSVRSSAGLADFDGDGITDFGIGSDDTKIYIFNGRSPLICETAHFSSLIGTRPQVAIYDGKGVFGTFDFNYVINLTDCSVIYTGSYGMNQYTSFGVFYRNGITSFVFSFGNKIYVSEENFNVIYPLSFTHAGGVQFSSPLIDDIDGDGSLEFAIVSIGGGNSKVFSYRITNTAFSLKFSQFAHDRHNTSFIEYVPPSNLAPHLKFYDKEIIQITDTQKGCQSTGIISLTFILSIAYVLIFFLKLFKLYKE